MSDSQVPVSIYKDKNEVLTAVRLIAFAMAETQIKFADENNPTKEEVAKLASRADVVTEKIFCIADSYRQLVGNGSMKPFKFNPMDGKMKEYVVKERADWREIYELSPFYNSEDKNDKRFS